MSQNSVESAVSPIAVFPEGTDPLGLRWQTRWIWTLLAIGLVARLVRYLLRFPLWEDEAMLATNFLDRGYLDLLKPLNYCQVGAPLFLWGQLTAVKLLGFTEYSLRLIPFVCSMASVLLFQHVAARLLKGTALVLAVGLFAVAYPGIRYASEAKPYGCDLFFALLMLSLLVEWWQNPQRTRWLWGLTGVIGMAVGYSYPAVFVGGAVSLIVAYVLWSNRCHRGWRRAFDELSRVAQPSGWLAWAAFNFVMAASFAVLLLVSRAFVGDTVQQRMADEHWWQAFPPLTEPLELLWWLVSTHVGPLLAYPVGGPNGGSTLSFLFFVAGVVVLCRRRQRLLLAILLVPLLLNFVAAAMHRYPYGGHVKLGLYDAAAFCMLPAVGITSLLAWYGRRCRPRARGGVYVVLGIFLAVVLVSLLRDLTHPYKSGTTLRARDFARWFWFDLTHDGELVCLETDLKQNLSPGTFQWGWSALYLCNQRIYSPRHARGEPPRLDRVSADWPLRCVLFRSATEERDATPLDRWLETMTTRYKLVARDKYPFAIYDKWDSGRRGVDFIEVFKFVPNSASGAATFTGSQPADPTRR